MAYIPLQSIVAVQSNPSVLQALVKVTNPGEFSGSVIAIPTGTQNVSGSVVAFQGTSPWTIVPTSGSVIVTGLQGHSVSGTVNIGNANINVSGSVIAFPTGTQAVSGSVAALQGTNPWINTNVGSIMNVWLSPSIVGTYSEDAVHTTADKGLFVFGVRNDAVASFASANLDYTPFGHDSAGRVMIIRAPEESRVEGYNSVVSTSVTTLVGAAGTGLKNYITDIVLVNTGATTALITFRSGGGTSVLGYGIAPTGGGSNMIGFGMPLRTLANETFDFQSTTSSSVIYAKFSGYKAP